MHILVVDDKKSVLDAICSALTELGHSVETAQNGLNGFEKAQNNSYDIFIIDHLMPVMDGLNLVKNLSQHQLLQQTPIIFMTTQDAAQVKLLPENEFINQVLAKPICEKKLIETLNSLETTNTHYHSL